MSRKFKLEKDYYDEGFHLYKKANITIKPGVTVLVGCNGIGKTTLLHIIKTKLRRKNVPCITFDNLKDGGDSAVSKAGFYGNMAFVADAMTSSEGENIVINMAQFARILGNFVKTGEDGTSSMTKKFAKCFGNTDNDESEKEPVKERWILLDAIDSGLSVDNIVKLKEELFKTILEYNEGNEIYIIVSANEYEMARQEQCFDVYNGKYITFNDYEEYRQFILETNEIKLQRYDN
jgi:predicted ATP-dependent endonuclease of OLD family